MLSIGFRPVAAAAAAFALCWMGAEPAFAGEAGLQSEDSAADPAIIVTAERRDENLLDVPSSVAVLTGQALSSSGVEDLQQVGGLVPGLVISPPVGLTGAVYIRGVGADSRNIGFDTRVGVYVDGVYVGQSPAIGQSLLDVERVEVMRGPQGTFFGKNSIAGAVNIITRPPGKSLEGSLSLRAGSWNSLSTSGSLNLPLGKELAARIAVSRVRRDGWVHNLFDGTDLGNREEDAQRAQVRFDPGSGFSATVSFDHLRYRSHEYVADNLTDTFATEPDIVAPGPRQVMYSTTPEETREILGVSLALRYQLSNGPQIVSTSSYRRTSLATLVDEDWSAARWFSLDYRDRYRDFAQEFQLVSPRDAAVEYLVGLYFQHQNNFTDRQVPAGEDIAQLPFGIAPGATLINTGTIEADSFAGYFNLTAHLGASWKLDAGSRYSIDRKRVDWQVDGSKMPAFNLATGHLRDEMVDHDLSPSLSLSFIPVPSARLYLRYAEGYKSGGFNLDFVSADIFPGRLRFKKETVRSYETGLKLELPELSLNLELAAFLSRYADYQVNQFQDLGGGRTALVIANAASVETKGIEANISAGPVPGLTASIGASLLDARFVEFPGGGVAGADVSGNRLPYASKFSASTSLDYEGKDVGTGPTYPFAHVDVSYRSGFFTTVDNVRVQPLTGGGTVPYGYADGYVVVNAVFGLAWDKPAVRLSFWARNLLDTPYTNWMMRDFLGTILETRSEPRTIGAEARLQF